MTTVYLNAAYFPAVELLSAIGTAAILLYGGYQAIDGDDRDRRRWSRSSATCSSFFDPIQQLSQLYTTYQQGMAALDKIFDLLDTEPDMVDAPDAIDPGDAARRDRARRTSGSRYARRAREARATATGRCATSTCTIPPGQTVALVGETGAGKSTLAKLVARFYDPQRGRRAGRRPRPARAATRARCAASSGSCPRRASCSRGTIAREHRLRPARTPSERGDRGGARARSARSEFIDAARRTASTPRSASAASQLSAGQRQLVAFARALLAEPRILILDEATSNVDVRTERTIEQGLRAAARRAHRDRDRPPALDDPPARAGSSCSSTAGSSRAARTTS